MVHGLVNFHKITYACRRQPDREADLSVCFLETLLKPLPTHYHPGAELLMVNVLPQLLAGVVEFQEYRLCFPLVPAF